MEHDHGRRRSQAFVLRSLLGDDIMVEEAKKRNSELIQEIDYYESERKQVDEMNKAAIKVG